MAWSINYSSTSSQISFNVCTGASTTGGYFYILRPDGTVLPSTVGGIKLASNTCTSTPFVTQASEYTQQGTHTMVLADQTAPEPTEAQVWFYVTPSPFAVSPPSGSSTQTTYSCVGSTCTPTTCTVGTSNCYAESTCAGACSAPPPPPPTTCTTPGDINIFGTCMPESYLLIGGVLLAAVLLMK